jgi:hypothetical protein
VFAALFLGEVRSFYARFWWWDIGCIQAPAFCWALLVFLLFMFSMSINGQIFTYTRDLWHIFCIFLRCAGGCALGDLRVQHGPNMGTNMQKTMLEDPSGLTDTMWDLIVDVLGAFAISTFGWWFMKRDSAPS